MQKDDLFNEKIALLLDFDGTLVDLAPDPMGITVDPAMVAVIDRIATKTRTPLAIVTGRQIKILDGFLGLPHIPVSGNHGTEIRLPGSEIITCHVPPLQESFRIALKAFCKEFDCTLEDKRETAVIIAPHEAAFQAARHKLKKLLSAHFQNYALWPIGLSLEIHHGGFNKITGMREILAGKTFRGYSPVYIGDDVETYPGLGALVADGVDMFHVGPGKHNGFSSPSEVNAFLGNFLNRKIKSENSSASGTSLFI